ncbi:hypothetical protein [Ectobacillus funiculus]|uniref:Uncharacterized protein n=2 Tax=Ectobacillus funiculus TaxID=137993 RepID=A0ABV5WM67_9BACI
MISFLALFGNEANIMHAALCDDVPHRCWFNGDIYPSMPCNGDDLREDT